jgi:hypothetical protein
MLNADSSAEKSDSELQSSDADDRRAVVPLHGIDDVTIDRPTVKDVSVRHRRLDERLPRCQHGQARKMSGSTTRAQQATIGQGVPLAALERRDGAHQDGAGPVASPVWCRAPRWITEALPSSRARPRSRS